MSLRPVAAWVCIGWFAGCGVAEAGAEPVVPPIVGAERLQSWRSGVARADQGQGALTVACFGDSNTEMPTYTVALRALLQGCYGDGGVGYVALATNRGAIPGGPLCQFSGRWQAFDTSPGRNAVPPAPYYTVDGFWSVTDDPAASVAVMIPVIPGGATHRVRLHYQTGPGLGAFSVMLGNWEWRRIACAADKPGYAVTEPFVADSFRITNVAGRVIVSGLDYTRIKFVQGENRLKGGALVHALGNGWGMAAHLAPTDEGAFAAFLAAIRPDLITILFGTNDMHNDGRPERYRDNLAVLVQKLRRAAPDVGILVLACPEAGQTKPGVAEVFSGIAKDVAATNGCAFWDWRLVMGPRSRPAEEAGWMGDGLHYNALGGSVLAHLLLKQIGFDVQDVRHWPTLRRAVEPGGHEVITMARLGSMPFDDAMARVKGEPRHTIWNLDANAAEVRAAVVGDALAIQARVFDGRAGAAQPVWDGCTFDVYVSAVGSSAGEDEFRGSHGIVRQVVFHPTGPAAAPAVTGHQNGKEAPVPEFPRRVRPLEPAGYELEALIPLSSLLPAPDTREFLLDAAATVAAGPGAPVAYGRLFQRLPDGGAFKDNSQAALVRLP